MLSLLIFLPMIGGLVGWFCMIATQKARAQLNDLQLCTNQPKNVLRQVKCYWINHCAALVVFCSLIITLALVLNFWYEGLSNFNEGRDWFIELNVDWIPLLGVRFHLILDGFSIIMSVLTLLLTLLTVIYSRKEKHTNIGLYYFCLSWMCAGVIGLFMAFDLFLFFFFWEMVAIPLYFLIAIWGRRDSSAQLRFNGATKFLIFTQISSLLMLISIVSLALMNWNLSNHWTFDYYVLVKTPISSYIEFLLMLGFFVAFAVRIPFIPFHGWFIDAHIESSTTGSMMISGLLTNTAIYGMLRFVIPMFPNASIAFAPIVVIFSLCTLFYSALLAFNQNDIKRLIAYIHIALMSFIIAMIYIGNTLTYQGIVIQTIAMNIAIVGLFVVGGLLTERYMTRNIKQFVGLRGRVNYLPAFTVFFALAIIGVPGTANFVGNLMLLFGSYTQNAIASVLLAIGLLLVAIALIIRMQPIFYGLTTTKPIKIEVIYRSLTVRDLILLVSMLVILIVLGIYPQPILDTSYPVISKIQHYLSSAQLAVIKEGA